MCWYSDRAVPRPQVHACLTSHPSHHRPPRAQVCHFSSQASVQVCHLWNVWDHSDLLDHPLRPTFEHRKQRTNGLALQWHFENPHTSCRARAFLATSNSLFWSLSVWSLSFRFRCMSEPCSMATSSFTRLFVSCNDLYEIGRRYRFRSGISGNISQRRKSSSSFDSVVLVTRKWSFHIFVLSFVFFWVLSGFVTDESLLNMCPQITGAEH